jgi:hypothetical protein
VWSNIQGSSLAVFRRRGWLVASCTNYAHLFGLALLDHVGGTGVSATVLDRLWLAHFADAVVIFGVLWSWCLWSTLWRCSSCAVSSRGYEGVLLELTGEHCVRFNLLDNFFGLTNG